MLTASPAWAHVVVAPSSAPKGSFAILSFSVPDEEANANTVKLQVQFPQDHPIANISVQPKPGWTYTVTKRTLAKPIKTDDGTMTEVVDTITWQGGVIKPGEFDLFTVSAGPLPTNTSSVTLKALQTYSDGDVVSWIEIPKKGAPEPEHPAPVLKLTKAQKSG
jgi:uncharacterized protein YcnI